MPDPVTDSRAYQLLQQTTLNSGDVFLVDNATLTQARYITQADLIAAVAAVVPPPPAAEQDRQFVTFVNEAVVVAAFAWTPVGAVSLTTNNTTPLIYDIDFNGYVGHNIGSAIGLGLRLVVDGSPLSETERFSTVDNLANVIISNLAQETLANGQEITLEIRSNVAGTVNVSRGCIRVSGS